MPEAESSGSRSTNPTTTGSRRHFVGAQPLASQQPLNRVALGNTQQSRVTRSSIRTSAAPAARQYFCHRCLGRQTFADAKCLTRHFQQSCEINRVHLCRHCLQPFARPYKRFEHHTLKHEECEDVECRAGKQHGQQGEPAHHALGCGLCSSEPRCFYRDPDGYRLHHVRHCHLGARHTEWNAATQLDNLLRQPGVVDIWLTICDEATRIRFLPWCVRGNLAFINVLEGSPATPDPAAHTAHAITTLRSLLRDFLRDSLASGATWNILSESSLAPLRNTPVVADSSGDALAWPHVPVDSSTQGENFSDRYHHHVEVYQHDPVSARPFDLDLNPNMLLGSVHDANMSSSRPSPTPALAAIRGGSGPQYVHAPRRNTTTAAATQGTSTLFGDDVIDADGGGVALYGPSHLLQSFLPAYRSAPDLPYDHSQDRLDPTNAMYGLGNTSMNLILQGAYFGEEPIPIETGPVGDCWCSTAFACCLHQPNEPRATPGDPLVAQVGTQAFTPCEPGDPVTSGLPVFERENFGPIVVEEYAGNFDEPEPALDLDTNIENDPDELYD